MGRQAGGAEEKVEGGTLCKDSPLTLALHNPYPKPYLALERLVAVVPVHDPAVHMRAAEGAHVLQVDLRRGVE